MSISYGGDNITFPDGSTQNTSPQTGFVNRIINGDMRIDQRNAGAAVTTASGYVVDRWLYDLDTQAASSGTTSKQQSSVAPVGFVNSLLTSITTAGTVTAAQRNRLQQRIEGFNTTDLGWGTASAQTVTLSFWVRSSLTGTFAGALTNYAGRSYPFTFTVVAANTWEQKTVVVAGDTTGTWNTTNGIGIGVIFDLGSGSNYNGTAGAWAAGEFFRTSGSVSVVGTSGATFYITGVSLVKGSTALPWEFRSIGQELALCQRYWRKNARLQGIWVGISSLRLIEHFVCTMRAAPTVSIYDAGAYHEYWNQIGYNGIATIGYSLTNDIGTDIVINSSVNRSRNYGDPAMLESGALAYSAEL